jgi:hypothetical protein
MTEGQREASKVSPVNAMRTPRFTSGALPETFKGAYVGMIFGDRKQGRWDFLSVLGELILRPTPEQKIRLEQILGPTGTAAFSGVGSTEVERSCTAEWSPGTAANGSPDRKLTILPPSRQMEDTELIRSAAEGEVTLVHAEDADLLLIGLIEANRRLENAGGSMFTGDIFIRMSQHDVASESGGSNITEEYFSCKQLALSIQQNASLASIEQSSRVSSVVAALILLGGDTTSSFYISHMKGLMWYLEHALYVGSLVRRPSVTESSEGWTILLDAASVERFIKCLYTCRDTSAVCEGWNGLTVGEKHTQLSSYATIQSKVAAAKVPRTTHFMPSLENLSLHTRRSQLRIQTWSSAHLFTPPVLPLVGFRVEVQNESLETHVIDEPTQTALSEAAENGFVVIDVTPIVLMNTPFQVLFGDGGVPRQLLFVGGRKIRRAQGMGKEMYCTKCRHKQHGKLICEECKDCLVSDELCIEVCFKCFHPPHLGGACALCTGSTIRSKCVEHCPLCRHCGKRSAHGSAEGCVDCGSSGRCAKTNADGLTEGSQTVLDTVLETHLEHEEEDDGDDDAALQVILEVIGSAHESPAAMYMHGIIEDLAETGEEEVRMLLEDRLGGFEIPDMQSLND